MYYFRRDRHAAILQSVTRFVEAQTIVRVGVERAECRRDAREGFVSRELSCVPRPLHFQKEKPE
jgi:hypothetical protein